MCQKEWGVDEFILFFFPLPLEPAAPATGQARPLPDDPAALGSPAMGRGSGSRTGGADGGDEVRRESVELRGRIAQLSAASLRIGSSLDLDTVLDEIAASARALTGARYAAIATMDEAGAPQDFVTSGFTEAEHQAMAEWADGPKLFEHFRDLEGPLRIADVPGHVRALGFSPDRLPWGTFQGTPMRHHGVHVGNFYLVEKEGGEAFTDDDEEILVLFGAQAAAAIANARAYRDEQRARADLEALVETSPVGVVVLDAATGRAVSVTACPGRERRRGPDRLRPVRFASANDMSSSSLIVVLAARSGQSSSIASTSSVASVKSRK